MLLDILFQILDKNQRYRRTKQRKGIIPNIEVYPKMDDIMAGRDEVFEAVITFINSN